MPLFFQAVIMILTAIQVPNILLCCLMTVFHENKTIQRLEEPVTHHIVVSFQRISMVFW